MKTLKLVLFLLFLFPATAFSQQISVKSGEKIAFLGDSITAQGAANAGGYVRLVVNGLELQGVKVKVIPAGVSGNTSRNMLARLQTDVLDKKPDWLALSCGVNDVWHGDKGVPLDEFQKNVREVVDRAGAANIKVILLTATMIKEGPENDFNKKLVPYNEFLRALATEKKMPLADLNADIQAARKAAPDNVLTVDGVHMNAFGNQVMAAGVLRAMGLDQAQLNQSRAVWDDLPGTARVNSALFMTARQYIQLRAVAAKQNRRIEELVTEELGKTVARLLGTPVEAP